MSYEILGTHWAVWYLLASLVTILLLFVAWRHDEDARPEDLDKRKWTAVAILAALSPLFIAWLAAMFAWVFVLKPTTRVASRILKPVGRLLTKELSISK